MGKYHHMLFDVVSNVHNLISIDLDFIEYLRS
jgi:hypothetical protein